MSGRQTLRSFLGTTGIQNPSIPQRVLTAARAGGAWILLVLLASSILLPGLGKGSLRNSDDAISAWTVREMSQGRSLLDYTFQNGTEHSRPLLFFWLTALSVKGFGDREFSLRLVSALATIFLTLIVGVLAKKLGAGKTGALLAGILFLSFQLPIEGSRRVAADALLSLFLAMATLLQIRARAQAKGWVSWGLACGLVAQAKGLVAVICVLCALTDLVLFRRDHLKTRWPYLGMAVAFLVFLPWPLLETVRYGMSFWREYVGFHILARASQGILGVTPWFIYFRAFLEHNLVLFGFSAIGLFMLALSVRSGRIDRNALVPIVLSAAVPVLLFSISKSRAEHYMLPAYAPLAILAATGWATVLRDPWFRIFASTTCLTIGWIANGQEIMTPDYHPSMKFLGLEARGFLQKAEPLFVYDVFHVSAAYYSERHTVLLTHSARYFEEVTRNHWLFPSGAVLLVDPPKLSALLTSHPAFCLIVPGKSTAQAAAAVHRITPPESRMALWAATDLGMVCVRKPGKSAG